MRVTDRRQLILSSLEHEAKLKDIHAEDAKKALKLKKMIDEELKIKKNRQNALFEHDENHKKNLNARIAESDVYMAHLISSLNII